MRSRARMGRSTVGLLIDNLSGTGSYQASVFNGVKSACAERNLNLLCFTGGSIGKSPRNVIYDLIASTSVDGLLIAGGTIGNYISSAEFLEFCRAYSPLPLVSVGVPVADIPSVAADNESGMREIILHLMREHGFRRIAFIRGPEASVEAAQRFGVYRKVLADNGIPFDPDLVFIGNFLEEKGQEAVRAWAEKRTSYQAIVASNDNMAIGAIAALKERGIQVPRDAAVVGFDDIEDAAALNPALTTVRQPIYSLARRAVHVLADVLEGGKAERLTNLETEVVVRQSCGCVPAAVIQAGVAAYVGAPDPVQAVKEVIRQSGRWEAEVERASTSFFKEVESRAGAVSVSGGVFISTLGTIWTEAIQKELDLGEWQRLLSMMRSRFLLIVASEETREAAESLWQQARVLLSEMIARVMANRKMQYERLNFSLSRFGQLLGSTFDLGEINSLICRELPRLQIPSFSLSLFADGETPPRSARFHVGYKDSGRESAGAKTDTFPAKDLTIPEMIPIDRRFDIVVMPMSFKDKLLGLALLEAGPSEGIVYETVCSQLCTTLAGAELLNLIEKDRTATEEKEGKVESLVMPMIEAVRHVVDLTMQEMELIRKLGETSETTSTKIQQTGENIEKVVKDVNAVMRFTDSIDEMSSAVKILGLNAAIVAARVGSAGKGFAVIAGEIRKLADSTNQDANAINQALREVAESIRKSASAGRESRSAFQEMKQGVLKVIDALNKIHTEMDSLSLKNQEILRLIGKR